MDPLFAPEVDNFCSAGIIGNMMVGPLVDLDGNLKGVVQLFNKLSTEEANQITVQDKEELNCILTSLGEIVKSADQHYEFQKVCNMMYRHLSNMQSDYAPKL